MTVMMYSQIPIDSLISPMLFFKVLIKYFACLFIQVVPGQALFSASRLYLLFFKEEYVREH